MQERNFDQEIINEISKIEPYPGWDINSKIFKVYKKITILLWIALSILLMFITIVIILDSYSVLSYNMIKAFEWPFIFSFLVTLVLAAINFLLYVYMLKVYSKSTASIEANDSEPSHNYKNLMKAGLKSKRKLNVMRLIIQVNLNKVNDDILFLTQAGSILVFIVSFVATMIKISDFKFSIEPKGLAFFSIFMLVLGMSIILYLFVVCKRMQRKNSYALSIVESAITYKTIECNGVYKIKGVGSKSD